MESVNGGEFSGLWLMGEPCQSLIQLVISLVSYYRSFRVIAYFLVPSEEGCFKTHRMLSNAPKSEKNSPKFQLVLGSNGFIFFIYYFFLLKQITSIASLWRSSKHAQLGLAGGFI